MIYIYIYVIYYHLKTFFLPLPQHAQGLGGGVIGDKLSRLLAQKDTIFLVLYIYWDPIPIVSLPPSARPWGRRLEQLHQTFDPAHTKFIPPPIEEFKPVQ